MQCTRGNKETLPRHKKNMWLENSRMSLPPVHFLFFVVCSNPITLKLISLCSKQSTFNATNTDKAQNQSNNNVKMQSRLVEASRRASLAISSTTRFTPKLGFCYGTRSRTADPEIHSGEQEAGPKVHRGQPQGISTDDSAENARNAETERRVSKAHESLKGAKSPCEPFPKLKSAGVNQRLEPSIQQKREKGSKVFEEVSCVGFDGTPLWAEEKNKGKEDDRDYYKHHKASPLSEIEFADSRKPISQASDKTVNSGSGLDVIGWLPEQLETAEQTLMRAAEMWRQKAMRGDPDAPQSKVLRALRGEDF